MLMYGYIRHWRMPIQQSDSPYLFGIDLAKRNGDNTTCGALMQAYSSLALLGPDRTFPEIITMARRFRQHLTALNDENLGAYQDLSLQYAWNLAYEAKEDPSKLTGEFMDQDFKLEEVTRKKNIILAAMINYHRLHLSITFERDPLELYEIADSVVGFGV